MVSIWKVTGITKCSSILGRFSAMGNGEGDYCAASVYELLHVEGSL